MALPPSGPISLRSAADGQLPANLTVRETGDNRGISVDIYNDAAGADRGSAWCASLQYYRLLKAAQEMGKKIPKDFNPRAYTPTWKAWAISNGLWVPVTTARVKPSTLQVGDRALFYFASMGRIAHVECVISVHDWGCMTFGGNTGPDGGDKVEREGQGVYIKHRTWGQMGAYGGYARIPF